MRIHHQTVRLSVLFGLALLTGGCGAGGANVRVLRVMTHDSWAISDELLATFEAQHNVDVQILTSGDGGAPAP